MHNTSKPLIAVLDFQEQGCIHGAGRTTAERIESLLGKFPRYRVVERAEWMRRMTAQSGDQIAGQVAGGELSEECRFHPAWAAERLALLGLDAIVIGRLKRSPQGRISVSAILVDCSGIVFQRTEEVGVDKVDKIVSSLTSMRIANAIRLHQPPLEAEIACVRGSSLMMRVAGEVRLLPKERIRLDRTIEAVPDPYFGDDSKAFAYLTAALGEAEIIDVGGRLVLARYSGNAAPRSGEGVTLVRI